MCRRRRPAGTDELAPAATSVLLSAAGTHLATSHDDTTEGAVHYFQVSPGPGTPLTDPLAVDHGEGSGPTPASCTHHW